MILFLYYISGRKLIELTQIFLINFFKFIFI